MSYTAPDMVNVTRQIIYTQMLQRRFKDWLLGQRMINDRTGEFPDGDTAFFDQVGQRTVKQYAENTPVDFSKIDTSRIKLEVTEYPQDGFYITDKQKQDSWKAAQFWSANVDESLLAFERQLETDILSTANQQVLDDPNLINGQPHRFVATGTNQVITLDDLRKAKLSMDKARVPAAGRVLLIDPSVEFTLNALVQITEPTSGDIYNKDVQGIINTGFGSELMFNRTIFGFNIMISHNLPKVASETIDAGAGDVTVTNGVVNIALSMASADATPFMGVLRQSPQSEFYRNTTYRRDEWSTVARWGFALQRPESLVTILTSETGA